MTQIKIEAVLRQAELLFQADHDAEDATKAGRLRGGSSGILTPEGEIIGNCHRLSLSRFLGVSKPVDDRSPHFFAAGAANEDRWLALLKASWSGVVLAEEEIPVVWDIEHPDPSRPRVTISGRPDIVLCDEDSNPQVGLELKAVCSSYRAVKTFLDNKPDAKHLIQSAHYSWKLGKLPWILSYASYSSYDTPGYAFKKFNTKERKIPPGRRHYYCVWDGDTFCYVDPVTTETVPTTITPDNIEAYYRLILQMQEHKDLGPRPNFDGVFAGADEYPDCKNCPYADHCDQYDADRDYDGWLDRIKEESDT